MIIILNIPIYGDVYLPIMLAKSFYRATSVVLTMTPTLSTQDEYSMIFAESSLFNNAIEYVHVENIHLKADIHWGNG